MQTAPPWQSLSHMYIRYVYLSITMTKPQTPNLSSLNDTFDLMSYDKQHGHRKTSTYKITKHQHQHQQTAATWTPCTCAKHLTTITRSGTNSHYLGAPHHVSCWMMVRLPRLPIDICSCSSKYKKSLNPFIGSGKFNKILPSSS